MISFNQKWKDKNSFQFLPKDIREILENFASNIQDQSSEEIKQLANSILDKNDSVFVETGFHDLKTTGKVLLAKCIVIDPQQGQAFNLFLKLDTTIVAVDF